MQHPLAGPGRLVEALSERAAGAHDGDERGGLVVLGAHQTQTSTRLRWAAPSSSDRSRSRPTCNCGAPSCRTNSLVKACRHEAGPATPCPRRDPRTSTIGRPSPLTGTAIRVAPRAITDNIDWLSGLIPPLTSERHLRPTPRRPRLTCHGANRSHRGHWCTTVSPQPRSKRVPSQTGAERAPISTPQAPSRRIVSLSNRAPAIAA